MGTTLDRSAGTAWITVSSDGIADAHWFENVAGSLVRRARRGIQNAQALCESLVVDTLANAREHKFNFENNLPAWDDLSLTLVALPAFKQPCPHPFESDEVEMMDLEPASPEGHGPIRKTRHKKDQPEPAFHDAGWPAAVEVEVAC